MAITDETLMAYADKELPAAESIALAAQIAADPELARRVEVFRASRKAFAGLAADPVPDALAARIRAMAPQPQQGNVVDLASRRRKVPLWQLPAAAAVALAVGLGAGLTLMPQDGTEAQVAALLDTLPSGEVAEIAGGQFAAVASFRTPSGELCREYEQTRGEVATVTVACRTEAGWDTRLAVATSAGEGYAPVSGIEALDAWLSATDAGDPLEAEDEAAALGN